MGSASRQTQSIGRTADAAISSIGDGVEQVSKQARDAAKSLATQASDQVMTLADQQVSAGAEMAAEIAESIRSAAAALDEKVPQLAEYARRAADRVENFSDSLREQSAAELMQSTAAFARRQPAVVFGAAAIGGFLLYRLFSAQPDAYTWTDQSSDDFGGQSRGAGSQRNWNSAQRQGAGYGRDAVVTSSDSLDL